MGNINQRLIIGTANILRHPKLFIMVPIITIFLFSFSIIYDKALRPFNGFLSTRFNNFTLDDGTNLPSLPWQLQLPELRNTDSYTISRLALSCDNAFKYDSLEELSSFCHHMSNASYVFSPLSVLPDGMLSASSDSDREKIEKYVLKVFNHDFKSSQLKFFFNKVQLVYQMVTSAQELYVYVLHKQPLRTESISLHSLKVAEQDQLAGSDMIEEFLTYYNFAYGRNSRPRVYTIIHAIQWVVMVLYTIRVYFCVSNIHKVRSNIGLLIGWLICLICSSFASLKLLQLVSPSCRRLFDTTIYTQEPFLDICFLFVMLFSSRNLYRTIHDLAGDSDFGEPQNTHKRLIKFYLGINSSIRNSEGVFGLSKTLRKLLKLDRVSTVLPIPNTSVILLINLAGFTFYYGLTSIFFVGLLRNEMKVLFQSTANDCYRLICFALLFDHALQLTYMVAIIVIDLHRIDLTDLLSKSKTEEFEHSAIQELNPICAKLLSGSHESSTRSDWKYKLGTRLLKLSPISSKVIWTCIVPIMSFWGGTTVVLYYELIFGARFVHLVNQLRATPYIVLTESGSDYFYYYELLTIIVLIVALSELTFTLTYSKMQRRNIDNDSITALISSPLNGSALELSATEEVKHFECITLGKGFSCDKLKLYANPKSPLLVSSDLDHNIMLWNPLSRIPQSQPMILSTFFESQVEGGIRKEFWPIGDVEISEGGDYIVLANNNNCRIKCFDKNTNTFIWEISLTAEIAQSKKMKPVTSFFRKKTVVGFLARKLLQRQQNGRRDSVTSISSTSMAGNYKLPTYRRQSLMGEHQEMGLMEEYERDFHREEFVTVLQTGEMITVSCDTVKIRVYNILAQIYQGDPQGANLKIVSSKLLSTARVNDRVVCNLSNDVIVIGSAINNMWRFAKLEVDSSMANLGMLNFAPPLMSRGNSSITGKHHCPAIPAQHGSLKVARTNSNDVFSERKKFPPINKSTIVTIDFVGMIVRVKDVRADLIDIQTGVIVKTFHIGSFKPNSFRVAHSEPTHCKFCGCVSVETMSLIYEDSFEKTLIIHTFKLENKKSRNNICLRVERDPREVRCLGFESVVETQYWYDDIEKWELTDMNVIIGVRQNPSLEDNSRDCDSRNGFQKLREHEEFGFLRHRNGPGSREKRKIKSPKLHDLWQGFVVTVSNGKLLEYNIPEDGMQEEIGFTRPNFIIKFGFKAVAIAFGPLIKILYLGNDKLIESDLYFSGTTSSLNPILRPATDGRSNRNELLFISKRRRMRERKLGIEV